MQVQGYQKKPLPVLLQAIENCTSIGQLFALVQLEGIDIQMKSQQSASNIPYRKLPNNPGILPLESLKKQVSEAAIAAAHRHTKEQLLHAIDMCPTIDKLFELVRNEHIVIQMKSQHSASCLPQKQFSDDELMPATTPLERLKEQVKDAVLYGK